MGQSRHNLAALAAIVGFVAISGALLHVAQGQFARSSYTVPLDREPINYYREDLNDPVAKLQAKLDAGDVELEHDAKFGYLPAVLDALGIPESSQGLVFSRTSLQLRLISPTTPRAIYFNDDVYIGYVQNSDMLEISTVDPEVGGVFYTLEQRQGHPQFVRDHQCLQCHQTARTQGVPGHLVRSVFTNDAGMTGAGPQFVTDHNSRFSERWGGWYVTGTHGRARHMGNVTAETVSRYDPPLDREAGANVADLSDKFNTNRYLAGGHSDLIALMVLEHQTQMHNVITRAGYEAKMVLHQHARLNEGEDEPLSEGAERRLNQAADAVLRYMLFVDEEILADPVKGTTSFAEDFQAKGKRDSSGRSLRDLDLQRRLFAYPCSYLIYSDAFDALPDVVLDRLYRRLWEVLTDQDESGDFDNLASRHRQAILEILRETKEGLPAYFHDDA